MIKIESGMFIGYLGDQQNVLGKIDAGIVPAIPKMAKLSGKYRLTQLRESTAA